MVITHPLDLAMVTAEAIMAVIHHMDGIMVAVTRLMGGIMVVVIEAVTAGGFHGKGFGGGFHGGHR